MPQHSVKQLTYIQEVIRKLVHLSSLWVVVLYHFTDKDIMLNVLIPLTLVVLLVDGARRCSGNCCPMLETILGYVLRNHEREKLSGASYLMVSALIMVLFFPKAIAMIAFAYLIIADTAAALVGKAIGKHHIGDKTIEGSLAFLLSCLGVLFTMHWLYSFDTMFLIGAIVAAVVAMLSEAASPLLKLDDNFTIPLSAGAVMLLFQWLAG